MYDLPAMPDELEDAPELAILTVLYSTLDQVQLALVAQHLDTDRSPDLIGQPPVVWVANAVKDAARHLQQLLATYRIAAVDDARFRACASPLPPSPPETAG